MVSVKNGQLLAAMLAAVQSGIYLERATAIAWQAMVAAATADRVTLWVTAGGGYTDLSAQRIRKAQGSASGISVAPVGSQTHGWGNRVDVGSFGSKFGASGIARAQWLHAHAASYGFSFEFGARDPNHLAFTGTPAGTTTTTTHMEDIVTNYNLGGAEPKDLRYGWTVAGNPVSMEYRFLTETEIAGLRNAITAGHAIIHYLTQAEWDTLFKDWRQVKAPLAAGKIDMAPVLTALADLGETLPAAVLQRFRDFWSTGK